MTFFSKGSRETRSGIISMKIFSSWKMMKKSWLFYFSNGNERTVNICFLLNFRHLFQIDQNGPKMVSDLLEFWWLNFVQTIQHLVLQERCHMERWQNGEKFARFSQNGEKFARFSQNGGKFAGKFWAVDIINWERCKICWKALHCDF